MATSNYLTLSHLRKVLAALDPRFKKIESDISKTATKEYVDTATSEAVAEEAATIETEINGLDGRVAALESATVDDAMSATSTNPVQNKVIYLAMQGKADASSLAAVATSGSYNDLSNKPSIPSISGLQTQAITDAGGYFNTDTVEAALQQLGAATAGISPNLSGLADTNISNPADGQVLQYDATSSKWINTTLPAGITETRVNELIAAALAQYGDGDTASYGYADASEEEY